MHTVHPTLLIGPSDWQSALMPQDEFVRRIDALWQAFPEATRAIVYGSPRHHAELAYLTNLVPKLEAAVALLTRDGAPRLFLGGGPNMVGAAKPLTWIANLAPLRGGQAIGQMATTGARIDDIIVIRGGAMPSAFRQDLSDAIGGAARDATAHVWKQMGRKSAHELAVLREAAAILGLVMAAIDQEKGGSVTAAILAGERAANRAGAQDVRILFSRNGGRTLEPFVDLVDETVDPLQVYVAVRHCNYWAEGFASLSARAHAAKTKAYDVLRRALETISAGTATEKIEELIAGAVQPDESHPVTRRHCASIPGLDLEDAPFTEAGVAFEANEIYSLKVGIRTSTGSNAIVSAMMLVRPDGNDVLWMNS